MNTVAYSEIRIGIVLAFEPGERDAYPLGVALARLGVEWIPIEVRHLRPVVHGSQSSIKIQNDPLLSINSVEKLDVTAIVWRISEADFDFYADIFEMLAQKFIMINSLECTRICADKWKTALKLAANNIPVIPSELLMPGMEIPAFARFKTVIKPAVGASGNGVVIAEPGAYVARDGLYIAQPLVPGPSKDHIRVVVCGDRPIVAIHRVPNAEQKGSELEVNNVAVGGTPAVASIEPVRELAIKVAECLQSDIIGIDFIPWDGGYAVLEVNSSPGFNGVFDATGTDCFQSAAEQIVRRLKA